MKRKGTPFLSKCLSLSSQSNFHLKWNQPHPHSCHYTIHAHCYKCMFCPIPTPFLLWKVSIVFGLSIDLQATSKILSLTSTSWLPHGVFPQHQLIKAFFPPPLCFLPSPSPCPSPSLVCQSGQSRAWLLSLRWPTRQSDILLSAEPDGNGVMWEMMLIAPGCRGSFISMFP